MSMNITWIVLCMLAVLMLAGSMSFAEDREPSPELKVHVVKDAKIKVDGSLDEEIWSKAASSDHFRLTDGGAIKGKCRLLVVQDEKNLYVGVEVFASQADLKKLIATHNTHDADGIWDDDVVELFIDPTNQRRSYYEFIMNSKGVTFDAYHSQPGNADIGWNPQYQAAAKVGKNSWTAEFALPLNMFDKHLRPLDKWMFNVLVYRTVDNEYCYWSSVYQESVHAPQHFGTLVGLEIPANLPASQPASRPVSRPSTKP